MGEKRKDFSQCFALSSVGYEHKNNEAAGDMIAFF